MNKGFIYLAPALLILAVFVALFPGIRKETEPSPLEIQAEMTDQTRFMPVEEVADAIIRKDPSLCLVDLRPEGEFKSFALSGAVSIPVEQLLDSVFWPVLSDPNKTVVLYSTGDVIADRAWLLLKRKGIKDLFVMKGGLNQWYTAFFQPVEPLPYASNADIDLYRFRLAVGQFFSGASALPPVKRPAKEPSKPPQKVELKPVEKPATEGGC